MLERLQDFPDNVVAVRASGEITADDYKTVLVPAVDRALAGHGEVRVLYQIGPDYKGFSPGAAWADSKLGLSHWSKFGRVALVTDIDWLKAATRMFAPFFPHEVRIFSNAEMPAARDWIVAEDTSEARAP